MLVSRQAPEVPLIQESIRRIPRYRWRIGGLLGIGVLINYFDRISVSVAGPQLERSFHLTPIDLGLLFSAFFWSYALLQIPVGLVLDRFGVTRVGRWSAFLWSAASALTACAGGFAGIFLARLLLGVAEAPSFPASSKATGYWFPRTERAFSTSLYDVGSKFSNVIGVPLVALAVVRLGWRWGFAALAALSFVYFAVFYRLYRDPSRHPRLTSEEREYLAIHGAEPEGQPSGNSTAGMLAYLLGTRKVWGLAIGFGAYGYSFYLFLTWLPEYLVRTMHRGILASEGFAAIPWACASAADLLARRLPGAQGPRRNPCPQGGTGDRHVHRCRGARGDGHHPPGRRADLHLHRAGGLVGGRAGGLVPAFPDRAERRRRNRGRDHEFLQQHDGRGGAHRYRLRRRPDSRLRGCVPRRRPRAARGHRVVPVPARPHRAVDGAGV
jgi:MFS family permease